MKTSKDKMLKMKLKSLKIIITMIDRIQMKRKHRKTLVEKKKEKIRGNEKKRKEYKNKNKDDKTSG